MHASFRGTEMIIIDCRVQVTFGTEEIQIFPVKKDIFQNSNRRQPFFEKTTHI